MIQVFQPTVGTEELEAIRAVFESNWLGKGRRIQAFELAFAQHLGVDPLHLVGTTCATEALFQVMQLIKVDHVILPAVSFVGAGNAALEAGSRIVLCDVDRRTLNPTPEHIDQALIGLKSSVAVVLLHYGGAPCDMRGIAEALSRRRGETYLIEDCAGAVATRFQHQMAGTFGHFGIWSFDAMKTITTGDGGIVWCQTVRAADLLRKRVYLGMDTESGSMSGADQWWEFRSDGQGRRAVMNDVAAAIGIEQLAKLPDFIARRQAIHRAYDERLAGCADWLSLPPALGTGNASSYTFYWIQTVMSDARDGLASWLRERGIYTTFRYWPLHRVYDRHIDLPGADWAADHTLLLPLHQGLSDQDVEFICDQVQVYGRERISTTAVRVA